MRFVQELERRFAAWVENLDYVYEHNLKPGVSYWVRSQPGVFPGHFAAKRITMHDVVAGCALGYEWI
jgi:hypothetical protein